MGVPAVGRPSHALVNDGTTEIYLSTGFAHRFLALELKATYECSDGNGVVHEDEWGAWIERLELLPAGVDQPLDVSGYCAEMLAWKAQGGPSVTDALPAANGANVGRLVLPIYSILRDAANPFNALFDPRGLASYRLRIRLRDLDDVITNTDVSNIGVEVWVHEYAIDQIEPAAGLVLESRYPTIIDEPPGAGVRTVSLKRGGVIRSILFVTRDDAPLSGARDDDVIDTITIKRNTSERVHDTIRWRVAKESPVFSRDFQTETGVGWIDFDIEGTVASDAMLAAEGSGVESLDISMDVLKAGHITIVPQYLVRRGA